MSESIRHWGIFVVSKKGEEGYHDFLERLLKDKLPKVHILKIERESIDSFKVPSFDPSGDAILIVAEDDINISRLKKRLLKKSPLLSNRIFHFKINEAFHKDNERGGRLSFLQKVALLRSQIPNKPIPQDKLEPILIVGIDKYGERLVKELINDGHDVCIIDISNENKIEDILGGESLEILRDIKPILVEGSVGKFFVVLKQGKRLIKRVFSQIILSFPITYQKVLFPIIPEKKVNIISSSELEDNPDILKEKERIGFTFGLYTNPPPFELKKLLDRVLALLKDGKHVFIFHKDIKVAYPFGEFLYAKAREKGALFFRLPCGFNKVKVEDGLIHLFFNDLSLIQHDTHVKVDMLVLEDRVIPHPSISLWADLLRLETGPKGFIQKNNIHRFPFFTNRVGIYVTGPSRGQMEPHLVEQEIDGIILEIKKEREILKRDKAYLLVHVKDRESCAKCLTCYRVCPHRAIYWTNRPEFSPYGCKYCGLCISSCPASIIGSAWTDGDEIKRELEEGKKIFKDDWKVIFGCKKSASYVWQEIADSGTTFPSIQFVEVECAGRISEVEIGRALSMGAKKIMVVGCHRDNCSTHVGTKYAERRINQLKAIMGSTLKETIFYKTVSKNQPGEFISYINEFLKS